MRYGGKSQSRKNMPTGPLLFLHPGAAGGILVGYEKRQRYLCRWEEMVDQMQDQLKRAAQSLLENEALTEGLADAPAQALLSWAVVCAEIIVGSSTDPAQIDARLGATRQLVRRVRRWLLQDPQAQMAPEVQNRGLRQLFSWAAEQRRSNAQTLDRIIQEAREIYVDYQPPSEEQRAAFLQRWPTLAQNPLQMIGELRQLVQVAGRDDRKLEECDDKEIY